MPISVSITEYPSMPGRYKWSANVGKKQYFGEAGRNPEAAAAVAIDKATQYCGPDGYTIFAPRAVLSLIPEDMRSVRGGAK